MASLPELLQDHFLAPRCSGPLEGADGLGRAENSACGDELALGLWMEGAGVRQARFQARGCSAVIAVASWLCEQLGGRTLAEVEGFHRPRPIAAAGGLPAHALHAQSVVQRALDGALRSLSARYP